MGVISKQVRALGLCSGGLDSMLSALVLQQQGISVEWITFETPFFSPKKAQKAAKMNHIPLRIINITPIYLEMLKNPPGGFGKYLNPCLDCHTLMFRLAGKVMEEKGYDFLFSGEVLGQRPMSQTRSSLRYVEKHSGYDGLILRPLSAKRLPGTLPEKRGWVNRELLLDITGRSRKKQITLAKVFGLKSFPAPAGGCLLTNKGYCIRLKELWTHSDTYTEKDLFLLKYGRHFRLEDGSKMIIGRSQSDNQHLIEYYDSKEDALVYLFQVPGPTALVPKASSYHSIYLAARTAVGYSKAAPGMKTSVLVSTPHHHEMIQVTGIPPGEVRHLMIQ